MVEIAATDNISATFSIIYYYDQMSIISSCLIRFFKGTTKKQLRKMLFFSIGFQINIDFSIFKYR